ncbi:MAG: hypothetical protein IJN59_03120, partial [Oscillospiraceae bacterium]|nr:hypothetical protein [Oscillospiraceae bacterium]
MAIAYESKPLPAVTTLDFNISHWAGVNKTKGAQADYEMADCKNMGSNNYPYASPRASREKVLDEADIQRIYKVEGDKLYYIDGENYLCFSQNGVKGYVTHRENEVETKIQMADCGCTNNYDKTTVFYPTMRFLKTDNTATTIRFPLVFGEPPENAERVPNKSGYTYYYGVYSQYVFIEDINSEKVTVTMTLPEAEEYGYSQDFSPSLRMYIYGADGVEKTHIDKYATVTGQVNSYTYTIEEQFEEGDYLQFYLHLKETTTDFRLSAWKNVLNYAISAVWYIDNDTEVATLSLDYGVVYNNRIVGVSGSDIRVSALGDFTNFHEFVDEAGNPSATGAYATDVGSAGDFTGICAYNNVLLLFKRDIVYEMYGSMPYTITELCRTGCVDNDSIASIDGVLYWASPKGIVRYGGGVPVVISQQTDIDTSGICKAGTDGRKYYVYDGKRTYVYDTYYQMWHIEDNKNVKMFFNHINALYAVCDDGIYRLNCGSEAVEWEFETKEYNFGSKERKNLSKLWLRAEMPKNSRLEVYVKQNGIDWQRVAVKTAEKDEMFDFKLRVKKCDSFALRFKGKGDVRILDIHGKV